jgi:hypothetical protein
MNPCMYCTQYTHLFAVGPLQQAPNKPITRKINVPMISEVYPAKGGESSGWSQDCICEGAVIRDSANILHWMSGHRCISH